MHRRETQWIGIRCEDSLRTSRCALGCGTTLKDDKIKVFSVHCMCSTHFATQIQHYPWPVTVLPYAITVRTYENRMFCSSQVCYWNCPLGNNDFISWCHNM